MLETGFHILSGNTVTNVDDADIIELRVYNHANRALVQIVALSFASRAYSVSIEEALVSTWPDEIEAEIYVDRNGEIARKQITIDQAYNYLMRRVNVVSPITISPVSGSTLTGSTVTFQWGDPNNVAGRRYDVFINGADQGSSITGNSWTVSGLPTDGSVVNFELRISDDSFATFTSVSATYTAHTAGSTTDGNVVSVTMTGAWQGEWPETSTTDGTVSSVTMTGEWAGTWP